METKTPQERKSCFVHYGNTCIYKLDLYIDEKKEANFSMMSTV